MKIGILTYHRTYNYGGCLQALATRTILERMGHEVYYIDYWPQYHAEEYKLFNRQKYRNLSLKGKLRYIANYLMTYNSRKKRCINFEEYHKLFTYPFCKPTTETYDAIVYGSDQIWRKQQATKTYNPVYFGVNDIKSRKHISFSASMGILPTSEEDKVIVKSYLSHLDSISVRESNLKRFIENLGFSGVFNSIDPTLMLTAEDWEAILPSKRLIPDKYILVYALWGGIFNIKDIRHYANTHDMKIVFLRGEANKRETEYELTTANPQTFLSLIKNAELVLSSSFHGLAFSILFHKEFLVSFNSNSERAKSLLAQVGLSERFILPHEKLPLNLEVIDYDKVEQKLHVLRKEAKDYLMDNLK